MGLVHTTTYVACKYLQEQLPSTYDVLLCCVLQPALQQPRSTLALMQQEERNQHMLNITSTQPAYLEVAECNLWLNHPKLS